MGDQNDDFQVNVSDATVTEPVSVPATPDVPQVSNLDNLNITPDQPAEDASAEQKGDSGNSSDPSDLSVSVSDDTAHAAPDIDQPPVDSQQQATIGPDDRPPSGDDGSEGQHTEQGADADKQIEEDSSREADTEPPQAEGAE